MRDGAHHLSFCKVSKEIATLKNLYTMNDLRCSIGIASYHKALVIESSWRIFLPWDFAAKHNLAEFNGPLLLRGMPSAIAGIDQNGDKGET
jgi:hypothetical protein